MLCTTASYCNEDARRLCSISFDEYCRVTVCNHKISMSYRQGFDTIPVKRGKGNSENSKCDEKAEHIKLLRNTSLWNFLFEVIF